MSFSRLRLILPLGLALLILVLSSFWFGTANASAHIAPQTYHLIVGSQTSDLAVQGFAFGTPKLRVHSGDTVVWVGKSNDFHTVTNEPGNAVPPTFTGTPFQLSPHGGNILDAKHLVSSGIITLDPTPYPFPVYHSFTAVVKGEAGSKIVVYCWVHGAMMRQELDIVGKDDPTQSQASLDAQIDYQQDITKAEGQVLKLKAASDAAGKHIIVAGIGVMVNSWLHISLVRFVGNFHAEENRTIRIVDEDPMMVHTLSAGAISNPEVMVGNPAAFKGGPFNWFFVPGVTATLLLTPVEEGNYPVYCVFHDTLGMAFTLQVSD